MGHADDRIHGRSNFVAHVGQKITLGPVGLIGGLFGRDKFFFHPLAFGDIPQRLDGAGHLIGCVVYQTGGSHQIQAAIAQIRMMGLGNQGVTFFFDRQVFFLIFRIPVANQID